MHYCALLWCSNHESLHQHQLAPRMLHTVPFWLSQVVISATLVHHCKTRCSPDVEAHDCRARQQATACDMLHFRRVIASWTDPSLGNCSYLDTCRHMKTCKYIHYELDDETQETGANMLSCVLPLQKQYCTHVDAMAGSLGCTGCQCTLS